MSPVGLLGSSSDLTGGMLACLLTTMPIPDSDEILDLAPTGDGLGFAAGITRRRTDGSDSWTVIPVQAEHPLSAATGRMDDPPDGHRVVLLGTLGGVRCSRRWGQPCSIRVM